MVSQRPHYQPEQTVGKEEGSFTTEKCRHAKRLEKQWKRGPPTTRTQLHRTLRRFKPQIRRHRRMRSCLPCCGHAHGNGTANGRDWLEPYPKHETTLATGP